MKKLLDVSYWFDILPGPPDLVFWRSVIICAVLCLMLGIVAIIFARKNRYDGLRRKAWYKLAGWGFTVGSITLVLAFFRFQNAYVLSMRAWIFGWIAFSIVWLLFIIRYWIFSLPRKIRARTERKEFEKYLPQKKQQKKYV